MRAILEGKIRQKLVQQMCQEFGFPRSAITCEKELAQLPHLLFQKGIPKRRLDILVMAPLNNCEYKITPLLLIECKAVGFEEKHLAQLLGYNTFVKAPFVALANQYTILFAKASFPEFREGLPAYNELLQIMASS